MKEYIITEKLFMALLNHIAQQPAVMMFMELQRALQNQQAQQVQQAKSNETKLEG
jgi:hypothetical protein